jgi:SAM-dependent methyltransferase
MSIISLLDRWWYPGQGDVWDETLFRKIILAHIRPGMAILDLGAGRGASPRLHFKGLGAHITGVDLDAVVLENPNLDHAAVISGTSWSPLQTAFFDLIFSANVLEHVQDPVPFMMEAARVLKLGGTFLAKTPNKWHYMPLVARFSPFWFHRLYNRLRGRPTFDTFPTVYRLNTPQDLARYAKVAGLEVVRIDAVEGRPEYLRLTAPTYFIGLLYERIVNALKLDGLKSVLFIEFKKVS